MHVNADSLALVLQKVRRSWMPLSQRRTNHRLAASGLGLHGCTFAASLFFTTPSPQCLAGVETAATAVLTLRSAGSLMTSGESAGVTCAAASRSADTQGPKHGYGTP
ncbi:hypothetical protein BDW02DRAFT_580488 [Decorospora gaudefroyi]|uniref:Uncharacterized protein n=1 Tax=Decorospora gaudefroyi TaxID=184978 RepID=A0A6A5K6K6_9PLEO|nr:hypothetical protein BDW02DRAFT_580488 [Decorospora gaudefroyi]